MILEVMFGLPDFETWKFVFFFFPIGSFKNSERAMELTLMLSVADDTFVYWS